MQSASRRRPDADLRQRQRSGAQRRRACRACDQGRDDGSLQPPAFHRPRSTASGTAIRRYQRPLSLLILDIDHFKSINDRYGHDVGDQVIIATCPFL